MTYALPDVGRPAEDWAVRLLVVVLPVARGVLARVRELPGLVAEVRRFFPLSPLSAASAVLVTLDAVWAARARPASGASAAPAMGEEDALVLPSADSVDGGVSAAADV